MTVRNDYQVSSEGSERHYEFKTSRLENATPTATQPFAVKSRTAGVQIVGTVLSFKSGDTKIIGDVTNNRVYKHKVRNVRTYSGAAEATWGAIDEGDPIYYDRSSTMPSDVLLSTSPLDKDGAANPLFGWAVLINETDVYPKGSTSASTQTIAVMQIGAGG